MNCGWTVDDTVVFTNCAKRPLWTKEISTDILCCFCCPSVKRNSRKLKKNLPNVTPSLFLVWKILPNEEHFHTVSSSFYLLNMLCIIENSLNPAINIHFFFHFSGVVGFFFSISSKYSYEGLTCQLWMHYW